VAEIAIDPGAGRGLITFYELPVSSALRLSSVWLFVRSGASTNSGDLKSSILGFFLRLGRVQILLLIAVIVVYGVF
jgi:hypothetical protein